MYIESAKYTNPGGHAVNEDSILCGTDLFAVADGLGGHAAGENASAAAIAYIGENYRGDISDEGITALIEGANDAVNRLNDGSHTTLAAAFVSGERLRMANVGDSRVYLFRNNRVFSVTKDHSVCQAAVEMGEMSFEDIRFSDDRSRLLKVLGTEGELKLKTKYEPVELYDGDAILLCSDGFWEYVHEREMEADLLKSDSAQAWLRLMLKRHLLSANNKGDNYSAVCAIVHSERKLPAAILPAAALPLTEPLAPLPPTEQLAPIEQKKPKRVRSGFIIALVIVLLLGAGAAAYWALGGEIPFLPKQPTATTESAASTEEVLPPESGEPAVTEATTPAITEAEKPAVTETAEPAVTETEPPVTETEPPVTETEPPVTETEPPVTETEPPVTETKPHVTETKPPVTETKPPVTETKPPVTETKPPVTETEPPVTETKPPVTETKPPVTETKPPVTETEPPVTETKPPVTETDPPAADNAENIPPESEEAP